MIRLPLTPEQLLWAELAVAALIGWAAGYALVLDWVPALLRLARRGRHERRPA